MEKYNKSNLKGLLEQLEKYDNVLNDKQKEVLGFSASISDEIRFHLLKKGWWSVLLFGSNYKCPIGLRIFPEHSYKDWSVVSIIEEENAQTLSPSLSELYPFCNLKYLNNNAVVQEIKDAYNEIVNLISDFITLVGGKDSLSFYSKYINTVFNETDKELLGQKIYIDFWKEMSKGKGDFETMIREVIKMRDEPSYIPTSLETYPFIWKSRVKNILGHRSIHLTDESFSESTAEKYAWEAFQEPHGFDTEGYDFNYYPEGLSPKSDINFLAEFVVADYLDHAKEIEDSPLYEAAKILGNYDNLESYTGVQHMEAAAIFDRNLKDPIMSWKCLVSAAYWSGQNTDETYLPIWEAAIELCEAQKWNDAKEALQIQYDFYIEYKTKI